MFARNSRHLAAATLLCLLSLLAAPARAQVTVGGDPGQVSPSDPNTWTSDPSQGSGGTWAFIGIDPGKSGTVTVPKNSYLLSYECYVGYAPGSSGTITVDGLNANWTNSSHGVVYIGSQGTGTLNVQNKGKAYTWTTYVGSLGGTGIVNVTGAGSSWTTDSLNVSGASTVTISNGGQAVTNYSASFSGLGNMVTVTGAGSTWNNAGPLYLYAADSGNTLTVSGGGKVSDQYAYLSGTTPVVTGAGSIWDTSGSVQVVAGTSTLRVDNGGTVTAGAICASLNDLQGDGTINAKGLISDVDLVFDATHGTSQVFSFGTTGVLNVSPDGTGDLGAGYTGTGTLRIADGVKIASVGGYVGHYAGSTGTATVTGAGSTWTCSSLYVGGAGAGTLNVVNGGTVTTGVLYAAPGSLQGDGTINATALVGGMDVVFDATHGTSQVLPFGTGGTLNLNLDGSGDLGPMNVRIADGVKISSSSGFVGYFAGTTSTAVVTGPGSSWINNNGLYVGYAGTGTLRVENGGTVGGTASYSEGCIGYNAGSSGTVVVTDPGSSWTSGDYVMLGYSGAGTLIVQNGGKANTASCELGAIGGSSGTATVTGPGSSWNAGGSIYVGDSGTGTLTVANGGTVSCTGSYSDSHIGYSTGSVGTATVTGQGSTWTNSGSLYVGDYGTGTLNITAGGKVTTPGGYIGHSSSAYGAVLVTDPGSIWINSGDMYLAYAGVGKGTLTVKDGGTVTTGSLHGAASDLYGNGTINTRSLVCDMDLVFDATHGPSQAFGTGGTLNLNVGGTGDLGVADRGSGSLRIADGQKWTSGSAYLAYCPGANGTAVITGPGSTWTNGTFYAGNSGVGSLTVDSGGAVSSQAGYVGYNSGAVGTATVTGAGSAWTNASSLYVGYSGTGSLTVAAGGMVSSATGYLGYNAGSSGAVNVIGASSAWTNTGSLYVGYVGAGAGTLTVANGGTVTAKALYACGSDLKGDGTINASGLICDMDLVFDATHGPGQAFGSGGTLTLADNAGDLGVGYHGAGSLRIADGQKRNSWAAYLGYNAGAAGTAVVTGAGSTWTGSSYFYIGYSGAGTLTVANGGTVGSNNSCYVGYKANSSGTVVVTDPGSNWRGISTLYVGYSGAGALSVANGGTVSGSTSYLGGLSGSSGSATIMGSGSAWTSSGKLYVGSSGTGILTVANGGKVTAQSVSISSASAANLHVTGNGMLVLGTASAQGSITNSGKVNLYADAFLAAGAYSPVTEYAGRAITWSGTGSYNAFGGVWDNTAKTFTVPAATAVDSWAPGKTTNDGRLLITDSTSGQTVGVSFGSVANNKYLVANPLSGDDLSGLPGNQGVLSAWNFVTNLTSGQAMLSFDVGAGQSNLNIWQYDGTTWTPFAAPDLTYGDDGIADFAVTSFSGYALTAAKHDGDANYDGAVDVIDLGVLAKNYDSTGLPHGSGQSWGLADFNDDGNVDVIDLGILARNYDWSGASAGAVPEPASMALLALGGLGLIRRRYL